MVQEEQLKQSGFLYWIWLGFQNTAAGNGFWWWFWCSFFLFLVLEERTPMISFACWASLPVIGRVRSLIRDVLCTSSRIFSEMDSRYCRWCTNSKEGEQVHCRRWLRRGGERKQFRSFLQQKMKLFHGGVYLAGVRRGKTRQLVFSQYREPNARWIYPRYRKRKSVDTTVTTYGISSSSFPMYLQSYYYQTLTMIGEIKMKWKQEKPTLIRYSCTSYYVMLLIIPEYCATKERLHRNNQVSSCNGETQQQAYMLDNNTKGNTWCSRLLRLKDYITEDQKRSIWKSIKLLNNNYEKESIYAC